MNYFQMPALYERISLWDSLLKFNNESASKIWNKTEKLSNDVFISVLEILKPDKIVFLSTEAYKAFKRQNKIYDTNKIFATVHPTCPWWNRKTKNGLSGKEELIKIFNTFIEEGK